MDVNTFAVELTSALVNCEFVDKIALQTEATIVRGRMFLHQDMFLELYFNEATGTIAFALIKDQKRIWGIDNDTIRGWHQHPIEAPETHVELKPMSVLEIVNEFEKTITAIINL